MKYSKELLLRSIKIIDKRVEKALNAGVSFSLPELINTVCVTAFLEGEVVENRANTDYTFAVYVLQYAAMELRETGSLEFGNVSGFWR